MTYSLFSRQGEVQTLASVQGYKDCYDFVKANGAAFLQAFFERGETHDIDRAVRDLDLVIPIVTDKNVKAILENLKQGLQKCQGWAIVSE